MTEPVLTTRELMNASLQARRAALHSHRRLLFPNQPDRPMVVFACSRCEWVLVVDGKADQVGNENGRQNVTATFNAHRCEDFPRPNKDGNGTAQR